MQYFLNSNRYKFKIVIKLWSACHGSKPKAYPVSKIYNSKLLRITFFLSIGSHRYVRVMRNLAPRKVFVNSKICRAGSYS
jgi:hypothetical protein